MEALPVMRHVVSGTGRFIVDEAARLFRLEFVPEKWRVPLAFSLRAWVGGMVALYICFYMQLDQPYWAAMTVWIVSQPTPGMALSKGYYRIIGTLVGAVAGLALVAIFEQSPPAFILALSLWIGACTLVGNLLRNFRGYGCVLAGFTTAIVALGSIEQPDHAFDTAIARASCTIIGIACAALMAWLFVKSVAREQTLHRLKEVIRNTARRGSFRSSVPLEERIKVGQPLLAELIALDTQVEFAAAESAQFRIHADGARSLLAHLFGAFAELRALEEHLRRARLPHMPEVARMYDATLKLADEGTQKIDENMGSAWEKELEALRLEVMQISPESAPVDKETGLAARYVLDRLAEWLRHMGRAVHDWKAIQGHAVWRPSLRLDFHRDQRMACINGIRAMVAFLIGGIFWIESGWSSGAFMLIQIGAVCSLFSTMPHPGQQAMGYLYGTLCAGVAALICDYAFLQSVNGFPLLAMGLAFFLIPGGMLLLIPEKVTFAFGYCVVFITLAQPLNQMSYDPVTLLNNLLASLVGVVFSVAAFSLLWPPNPGASRRYVVRRIRKGLQNISHIKPVVDTYLWQTRMFDRVNRLLDPTNPAKAANRDEWFDGSLASVNLGNEVLRLRSLEEEGKMSAPVATQVRTVLQAFRHLVADPVDAHEAIRLARLKLDEIPAADTVEQRLAGFRARGALGEMEAFFQLHPRFLTPS